MIPLHPTDHFLRTYNLLYKKNKKKYSKVLKNITSGRKSDFESKIPSKKCFDRSTFTQFFVFADLALKVYSTQWSIESVISDLF